MLKIIHDNKILTTPARRSGTQSEAPQFQLSSCICVHKLLELTVQNVIYLSITWFQNNC